MGSLMRRVAFKRQNVSYVKLKTAYDTYSCSKCVMQVNWRTRHQTRLAKFGYFTLYHELCREWSGTLHTGPYKLSGKQGRSLRDRPMACAEQLLTGPYTARYG